MTASKANTTDWSTAVDIKAQPVIVRPLKNIDILLEKIFVSSLSSETKRN